MFFSLLRFLDRGRIFLVAKKTTRPPSYGSQASERSLVTMEVKIDPPNLRRILSIWSPPPKLKELKQRVVLTSLAQKCETEAKNLCKVHPKKTNLNFLSSEKNRATKAYQIKTSWWFQSIDEMLVKLKNIPMRVKNILKRNDHLDNMMTFFSQVSTFSHFKKHLGKDKERLPSLAYGREML